MEAASLADLAELARSTAAELARLDDEHRSAVEAIRMAATEDAVALLAEARRCVAAASDGRSEPEAPV